MNRVDIKVMIQQYTETGMVVLDGETIHFGRRETTVESLSEI